MNERTFNATVDPKKAHANRKTKKDLRSILKQRLLHGCLDYLGCWRIVRDVCFGAFVAAARRRCLTFSLCERKRIIPVRGFTGIPRFALFYVNSLVFVPRRTLNRRSLNHSHNFMVC